MHKTKMKSGFLYEVRFGLKVPDPEVIDLAQCMQCLFLLVARFALKYDVPTLQLKAFPYPGKGLHKYVSADSSRVP